MLCNLGTRKPKEKALMTSHHLDRSEVEHEAAGFDQWPLPKGRSGTYNLTWIIKMDNSFQIFRDSEGIG